VRPHSRVERALYRLLRVDPDAEQRWTGYAAAVLAFSFLSVVALYLPQRRQALLPLSLGRGAVAPGIAFNTAVSFVTNTDWQSYLPETTMGHLVQMAGLTVQNFVSAAVGMAVAAALVRGFARASTDRIGKLLGRPHPRGHPRAAAGPGARVPRRAGGERHPAEPRRGRRPGWRRRRMTT